MPHVFTDDLQYTRLQPQGTASHGCPFTFSSIYRFEAMVVALVRAHCGGDRYRLLGRHRGGWRRG
ncbi:MAG: hypothetical protein TH68_00030 [Candidatus Synechococcus spongiarum 142]|uniref:Uncharacterized protein n=1 Tax=Candidatus Synechococcus spongiarum 142 TaxID=1608213 RepID=A0A6N3X338_9SYNE|nr:MAG: hypothetical protein TH68_00030 [Candidatus Synechococcus spongiarum 142]